MKTIVFTFGRMNPPTTGHELLVDKIKKVARRKNADAAIYLSQTQDPKKNPLSYLEKARLAKKAFGPIVKISKSRTVIEVLKELDKEYDTVIMVVGSDRVQNFEQLLNKYNQKEYTFDNIEVVSAGARDPDAEDVSGMSASKMRELAAKGDLKSFTIGLPDKLKREAEKVMSKVRSGMRLTEDVMPDVEGDQPAQYHKGLKKKTSKRRAQQFKRGGKLPDDDPKSYKPAPGDADAETKPSKYTKKYKQMFGEEVEIGGQTYEYMDLCPKAVEQFKKDLETVGDTAKVRTAMDAVNQYLEIEARVIDRGYSTQADIDSINRRIVIAKGKIKEAGLMGHDYHQGHLNKVKEMIKEDITEAKQIEGLKKKSEKSGIPYGILKKVYDRGMAAWKTGHRPGATQHQWAFARVNSFIVGGKTRTTADADLWAKAKKAKKEEFTVESIDQLFEEFVNLEEKATSVAQQKLMALALKYKRGDMEDSEATDEVKKLADSMSEKDLEDFASTKHAGLPDKKEEVDLEEVKIREPFKKGSTFKYQGKQYTVDKVANAVLFGTAKDGTNVEIDMYNKLHMVSDIREEVELDEAAKISANWKKGAEGIKQVSRLQISKDMKATFNDMIRSMEALAKSPNILQASGFIATVNKDYGILAKNKDIKDELDKVLKKAGLMESAKGKPPFDPDPKSKKTSRNSDGTKTSGMSRARQLAKRAMKLKEGKDSKAYAAASKEVRAVKDPIEGANLKKLAIILDRLGKVSLINSGDLLNQFNKIWTGMDTDVREVVYNILKKQGLMEEKVVESFDAFSLEEAKLCEMCGKMHEGSCGKMNEGRPPKNPEEGLDNIVMQLRKTIDLRGMKPIEFEDGSTMKVNPKDAQLLLNLHQALAKSIQKQALQQMMGRSKKDFMNALKLATGK